MENVSKIPEYDVFHQIHQRCYNDKNKKYPIYGGRGIKMCDRWLEEGTAGILNFLEDMGRRPDKGYSIERIDVNGDYEPSNCKWATTQEQNMNKRGSVRIKEGDIFGKLKIIKEVESEIKGNGHRRRLFLCECECGNQVVKRWDRIKRMVSCGLKPCNKYFNHTNKVKTL